MMKFIPFNILYLLHFIDSISLLFDNPWKLRIVPFIYSVFTAYFTYKIGAKFANKTVGLLALIILMTTLPYYNFSLQIRGYGLSFMLSVMLVYYLLQYFNNLKRKELTKTGLLACLLFYCIPSNLYFLLSIILALAFYIIINKNSISELLFNKYSFSVYAIAIGILLALLLYLPMANEVFSNKYVELGNYFNLAGLKYSVLTVLYGLIYNRWLIISLSIIGFFIGYKYLIKKNLILVLCISTVIVPLLIVWASGQGAPSRIFTFCLPFVSLFMATSLFGGWSKYFPIDRTKDWIIVSCVFAITIISLFNQLEKLERKLITDIAESVRTQSMYHQFYSARYWPLRSMKFFKPIYTNNKLPVVVVGCEPHGIPNYLEKFNIPYSPHSNFDSLLLSNDSVYVITNHPFKFVGRNDIDAEILNEELCYHNSLIIKRK